MGDDEVERRLRPGAKLGQDRPPPGKAWQGVVGHGMRLQPADEAIAVERKGRHMPVHLIVPVGKSGFIGEVLCLNQTMASKAAAIDLLQSDDVERSKGPGNAAKVGETLAAGKDVPQASGQKGGVAFSPKTGLNVEAQEFQSPERGEWGGAHAAPMTLSGRRLTFWRDRIPS
jgi:hypothetical protein